MLQNTGGRDLDRVRDSDPHYGGAERSECSRSSPVLRAVCRPARLDPVHLQHAHRRLGVPGGGCPLLGAVVVDDAAPRTIRGEAMSERRPLRIGELAGAHGHPPPRTIPLLRGDRAAARLGGSRRAGQSGASTPRADVERLQGADPPARPAQPEPRGAGPSSWPPRAPRGAELRREFQETDDPDQRRRLLDPGGPSTSPNQLKARGAGAQSTSSNGSSAEAGGPPTAAVAHAALREIDADHAGGRDSGRVRPSRRIAPRDGGDQTPRPAPVEDSELGLTLVHEHMRVALRGGVAVQFPATSTTRRHEYERAVHAGCARRCSAA